MIYYGSVKSPERNSCFLKMSDSAAEFESELRFAQVCAPWMALRSVQGSIHSVLGNAQLTFKRPRKIAPQADL
jgi:hypothetical protein